MRKFKTENAALDFEILSSDNDTAVYKRILPKKSGRSSKEIRKIEETLPTATIHYFDKDDFNNLKKIEAGLIKEYHLMFEEKNSTLEVIVKYLHKILTT